MWRSPPSRLLLRTLLQSRSGSAAAAVRFGEQEIRRLSSPGGGSSPAPDPWRKGITEAVNFTEAKRLMRLVGVSALKQRLGSGGEEVIGYSDLLEACQAMGVTRSRDEAAAFARVLDEAGVVVLFRDKVYLHPDKVVDLVKGSLPLSMNPPKDNDDPRTEELKELQRKKEEIDAMAHKQVRRILWSGMGAFVLQTGVLVRLTFWELSWDVMEPITFFTTAGGLLVGYAYFLFTSRDPTYQDVVRRIFLSRQRRLCVKHNFDADRYAELQKRCPAGDAAVAGDATALRRQPL